MKNKRVVNILGLVAASFVLGCDDAPSDQLSLVPGPPEEQSDTEEERLRQLQLISIVYQDADSHDPGPATKSAIDVALEVRAMCKTEVGACQNNAAGGLTRSGAYCDAAASVCAAQRLLDAASTNATPVHVRVGTTTDYLVPAQTRAASSSMARMSMSLSGWAMQAVASSFRRAAALPQYDSYQYYGANTDLDDIFEGDTVGSGMASQFVVAYSLYREAAEKAVDDVVAVADWQYSTTSSPTLASARSYAGSALSRVAGAHLLVGGESGLLGTSTQGFCSSPELTGPARRALGLLREAAVYPDDVLSETVSLGSLLNGPLTSQKGDVRERLRRKWGIDLTSDGRSIQEWTQLRDQDFAEARETLREEIRSFSRSMTADLGALKDPQGGALPFLQYAATSNPLPERRPDSYFSTLARYSTSFFDDSPSSTPGWTMPRPALTMPDQISAGSGGLPVDIHPEPLAKAIDFAVSEATNFIKNSSLFSSASVTVNGQTTTVATQLAEQMALVAGSGDRSARLRFCNHDKLRDPVVGWQNQKNQEVWVWGLRPTDDARLVIGEDGLSCAVNGNVEGAKCDDKFESDYLFVKVTQAAATAMQGFDTARYAAITLTPGPLAPAGKRIYLVRLRADRGAAAPGNFEAIGGFSFTDGAAENECIDVSMAPEAEQLAAKVLAPSRDWCSRPNLSCAGVEFDARMPLEDELSDDGDGVESSWKYYLARAKEAADEADLLGEAYVLAGLEADKRGEDVSLRAEQLRQVVESKLEAIQDICGTVIDSERLMDLLGTNGSLTNTYIGTACSTAAPCAAGYQCVGSKCIVDIKSKIGDGNGDPELGRLSECLADGASVDLVHLGEVGDDVCVWRVDGNPNRVCDRPAGLSTGARCPALKGGNDGLSDTDACERALGLTEEELTALSAAGEPLTIEAVKDGLGYYDVPETVKSPQPTTCSRIRELRKASSAARRDDLRLQEIVNSELFHPDTLKSAPVLGFEARFGGYVAITVDGASKFSTGDAFSANSPSGWPCSSTPFAGCNDGEGLFCTSVSDCKNNVAARVQMNARMMRAVIGAYAMTEPRGQNIGKGATGAPFVWPAFIRLLEEDVLSSSDWTVQSKFVNGLYPIRTATLPPHPDSTYGGGVVLPPDYPEGHVARVAWSDDAGNWDAAPPDEYLFTQLFAGLGYKDYQASKDDYFGAFDDPQGYFLAGLSGAMSLDAGPNAKQGQGYYYEVLSGWRAKNEIDTDETFVLPTSGGFGGPELLFEYSAEAMLDALELRCEVSQDPPCDLSSPPQVNSIADVPGAARFIECAADRIRYDSATRVLANLPSRAMDALRQESGAGSYPAVGGQLGTEISQLRGALVEVAEVSPLIADQVNTFARDLRTLHGLISKAENSAALANKQFLSTIWNQAASCAGSAGMGAQVWNQAVTCANSVAQMEIAEEIRNIQTGDAEIDQQLAELDFSEKFAQRSQALSGYASRLSAALESIDAQLATIEGLRDSALRKILEVVHAASFNAENQREISAVTEARFATAHSRYVTAHSNAVKLAFFAKRAIEQRLGVRLSSMTEELPLVGAPATWESTVCTSTGIDYDALRTANPEAPVDYSDEFIGAYVTKLENVVESYRLASSFQEGGDTAVISLRDDVQNVRAECAVEVDNLLYFAGNLGALAHAGAEPVGYKGWLLTNCRASTSGDKLPDCIGVDSTDRTPFAVQPGWGAPANAYTLRFGLDGTECSGDTCGFDADAALVQRVALTAGKYRFSWYGAPEAGAQTNAKLSGVVRAAGGQIGAITKATAPSGGSGVWPRYTATFDVTKAGKVEVGFLQPVAGWEEVTIAAPMLERVEVNDSSQDPGAGVFVDTGSERTASLPVCEDSDGAQFRLHNWTRRCVNLCADGFAAECEGETATQYCYRETSFNVSQRDIELGRSIAAAGFARGNFNYRIESIGVNFVGTGIRDCGDAQLPQTCYGGAFVPYTLLHGGPFVVRNYDGGDFPVELFNGRIEHARGLAAERYLSNPLSSADQDLLSEYTRTEFQGRPLDGAFVLRVWEEPGVSFDNIEDVQLVLKYRYWTRQN